MAWSYRKRIKIIPGVHLNVSRSGISTSLGVRGASLTLGSSGTFLNTSIPGTGISNRMRLNSPAPAHPSPVVSPDVEDNIFSAEISDITSDGMQGVKEAILLARQQRLELNGDLRKVKLSLSASRLKLWASYFMVYGLVKKEIPKNLKLNITAQKKAIAEIKGQIAKCYVGLDVEFDEETQRLYDEVVSSFRDLATSHKIWDVTSAHSQDRVAARSAAGTLVRKRQTFFGIRSVDEIKSNYQTLWMKNANGADLYFYPNFILMHSSRTRFAVIGLDELDFTHSYCRFVETGIVPKDSKIIDRTWAKVNKNGSPDKRFKGNYQIPIVKYGEISLRTATGVHEEFQISNYEFTERFGQAFQSYRYLINTFS